MPYVETSIVIRGDADAIYGMAKNMEEFPKYMPDVEEIKVVERTENRTVTDWSCSVEGTSFMWREEDLFDDGARRIAYRLIEGDLDKFEGEWNFTPSEDGTRVVLGVDFDFGIPNLAALIGPTLELKVRENSEMMLGAMKRHFEGRPLTSEPHQRR